MCVGLLAKGDGSVCQHWSNADTGPTATMTTTTGGGGCGGGGGGGDGGGRMVTGQC